MIFGKLFFAVTPFLNNSILLADTTLSGIRLAGGHVHTPRLAMANPYLLKRGPSALLKKCLETVAELFDDGRLDGGDFHRCACMIIVCCDKLLPNFGEYCQFSTEKVLAILVQCQFVGFSVSINDS
jgi:hypothetical protein